MSAPQGRKPLLVLLEKYILDCIGCLPEAEKTITRDWVKKAFGGTDDWQLTLRIRCGFTEELDTDVRKMWVQNQRIAKEQLSDLTPEQYARMLVDENFADAVEKLEEG